MRASCNASVADGFVARFGTMVETMATSRHVSALPSFAPRLIGSPVKGSRQLAAEGLTAINYQLLALRCDNRSLEGTGKPVPLATVLSALTGRATEKMYRYRLDAPLKNLW